MRILVRNLAAPALEAFGEGVRNAADLHRPGGAAAFPIRGLNRIGEPRTQVTLDLEAVHNDLQHGRVGERCGVDVFQRHRVFVDQQPAEALAPQRLERRADGACGINAGRRQG